MIANRTTKVSASRTIAEITDILVRHGASSVNISYERCEPAALRFDISRAEYSMTFLLPCDWRKTAAAMDRDRGRRKRVDPEQAKRVAWRVLRDWVRAQLSLIEIGAADLEQVMLPYAIIDDEGTTVYQRLLMARFKGLPLLPKGAS